MSLATKYLGTLLIALTTLGSAALVAQSLPQDSTDLHSRLEKLAPKRHKKVKAELASLGENHAWAGVYKSLGGFVLTIAPEAGFTLRENAWCNMCSGWRGIGHVRSVEGDTLTLDVELGAPPKTESVEPAPSAFALTETLYLVRWGDYVFAVPPWRMGLFCAEVAGGYRFPRVPYRYVGNDESFDPTEPERPQGIPRVPPVYAGMIPERAIEGTLTSLLEWKPCVLPDGTVTQVLDGVFEVDAGSDEGLMVGMYLNVQGDLKERFWWGGDGRIERVEPKTSRVVIGFFNKTRADAEQLVGTTVSTRDPRASD